MATLKDSVNADFATLFGTAAQMREKLGTFDQESQVVVLTFDRRTDDSMARAITETMMNVAPLVTDILARRERAVLESIVEALVPSIEPPSHLLTEARMVTAARKAVIDSGDWL